MLAKPFAAIAIFSALAASPVWAQTATKAQEQNASSTGQWQASQLIRLNVYDNSNKKLGDIKELMMNKNGTIETAVIGVGGILGAGEHDVAVKFSELKFSDQPVRTSSSSNAPATSGTTGSSAASNAQSAAKRNYPDHAALNMTEDQLKAMPQFNYSK